MFRTDPDKPFDGPHQGGEILTSGVSPGEATAAMILVHGRGASARSILGLASDLNMSGIHYVAPQAAGHTWYPYSFLEPAERNEPGLSSGLQVIRDLLTDLEKDGLGPDCVVLGGFSQGACLSSEYAARHPMRYGGVVALSGGLIGRTLPLDEYTGDLADTPVFVGCSDVDPHIPLERVEQTAELFGRLGARVNKQIYPGMPHTVVADELEHVRTILGNLTQNGN